VQDYEKRRRLDGKVALVTGAAQGIGAACAAALAQAGARVLLTDVLEEQGRQTADALVQDGLAVEFTTQDVTDEGQWVTTLRRAVESCGGLDVLVNNAGIEDLNWIVEESVESFRRIMRVNAEGVFLGMKHAALAMRPGGAAGRGGSIVNVSSLGSKIGFAGLASYGASKGAVEAITRCGAVEFAQLGLGIRVNSVHPGFIRTGMVDRGVDAMVRLGIAENTQAVEQLLAAQFLGGFGSPGDIAGAVCFLASDAAAHVNGIGLVIDGGALAA
jgi:NAD(P)-dependent dehydrogenase (short-subunit alcohol dehydrogenase family)